MFSSRRDAAAYLVCELLRTVWAGVAMNLHPPRVSAVAWMALFLPAVAGATAIDLRAKQLTRHPHGGIYLGDALGAPITMMQARQVFGTSEPWKDAFRWLGIDPEKAASARYVTLWITGILLATALVPVLSRQMA